MKKPEELGMSSDRLNAIRSLASSWINPDLHQTIVMRVLRKGEIVFQDSVGSPTPDSDSITPHDAIFPIASLSKVVTATAIMTMVEDGLLSLHNPVSDFIPEFSGEEKNKVLIWHLLTHTMGGFTMEEVDDLPFKCKDKIADISPVPQGQFPRIHEFLSLGYDFPLKRSPGTVVGYSNYGFELLGEVIRRISGISLAKYAKERIFNPLHMNDTHYILPKQKKPRLIQRHNDAIYAFADEYFLSGLSSENILATPWASCGVCSTANDLSNFGQMFLNGGKVGSERVLSPATVAYMSRNQTPGLPDGDRDESLRDASRGIGWDIPGVKKDLMYANLYSPSTFGHSGAGGILIWIDPTYELVGVFMSIELIVRADLQRSWAGDRFANTVTAAIVKN